MKKYCQCIYIYIYRPTEGKKYDKKIIYRSIYLSNITFSVEMCEVNSCLIKRYLLTGAHTRPAAPKIPRVPSVFPLRGRLRPQAISPTHPMRVKIWGDGPRTLEEINHQTRMPESQLKTPPHEAVFVDHPTKRASVGSGAGPEPRRARHS